MRTGHNQNVNHCLFVGTVETPNLVVNERRVKCTPDTQSSSNRHRDDLNRPKSTRESPRGGQKSKILGLLPISVIDTVGFPSPLVFVPLDSVW